MPAAAHTGAIAFGLVHIPIKLFAATGESKVSFNQLNKHTMNRIGYKKYDKVTGEEVRPEDIIKGYEYEKGQYIVLSEEELEGMKTPHDKAIAITQFVDSGSIMPILYDKAYYVMPDGSLKAFALLSEAMRRNGCVAVATTIFGTSDVVLSLTPIENGMLAQTLFYQNEIRATPMPVAAGSIEISDQEMNIAGILIQNMRGAFDISAYHDSYEEKLRGAIKAKISGQEIIQAQEKPETVIDLMDALQRSLSSIQAQPQPQQPRVH